ncbi:MAG: hypothetical protein K2K97_11035, partial [Muribaculaceae bacterium]|nr:hypothetical protein [Muribaculaceae bacterium]
MDKTSDIRIENLVLPVNMDAITLKDILDVDPESQIQSVTINGKEFYAVVKHGNIDSKTIDIPTFTVHTPDVAPTTANFDVFTQNSPKIKADRVNFEYHLRDFEAQSIEIQGLRIDKSVKELTSLLTSPTTLLIKLSAPLDPIFAEISFTSLDITIPKGLQFENLPSNYSYNPDNGQLVVTNLPSENNNASISLDLTGIDLTKYNAPVHDGVFSLDGSVELTTAILNVSVDQSINHVLDNVISMTVKTSLNDFTATHISGKIEYELTGEGLNIAPIELGTAPDFLNQGDSDLKLANPQIYVNLDNPVANDNLYYQSGLKFTAVRDDHSQPFEPDNNQVIATRPNFAGPYNFLLCPNREMATVLPEYSENLEFIKFSTLSDLLSGDGLPQAIDIELENPCIPLQTVTNFRLGQQINGISGSYDFLAPIALNDGSVIIYTQTEDGWYGDELEHLTIDNLTIDADVTNTIPLDAQLTVCPID